MIIQISKHAQEKMDIEGIDTEQIKRAIKRARLVALLPYVESIYK